MIVTVLTQLLSVAVALKMRRIISLISAVILSCPTRPQRRTATAVDNCYYAFDLLIGPLQGNTELR
jgi:hypothetical protein